MVTPSAGCQQCGTILNAVAAGCAGMWHRDNQIDLVARADHEGNCRCGGAAEACAVWGDHRAAARSVLGALADADLLATPELVALRAAAVAWRADLARFVAHHGQPFEFGEPATALIAAIDALGGDS